MVAVLLLSSLAGFESTWEPPERLQFPHLCHSAVSALLAALRGSRTPLAGAGRRDGISAVPSRPFHQQLLYETGKGSPRARRVAFLRETPKPGGLN